MLAIVRLMFTAITAVVANIGVFIATRLAAKFGIRLALIAVWTAALVALTATINGLLNGLVTSVPPIVQTALGILPASTGACISAIAATHAAAWLYIQLVTVASVKARI